MAGALKPIFITLPVPASAAATTTSSTLVLSGAPYPARPDPGLHTEAKLTVPPAPAPAVVPIRGHELGLGLEWSVAGPPLAAFTFYAALLILGGPRPRPS
jgi:hypothetical protein